MRLTFTIAFVFCCLITGLNAQVFYTESFETETGWTMSHEFDNGGNSYAKRDLADGFTGLEFTLWGQHEMYLMGAENTESGAVGAPEDGVVTVDFDEVNIAGKTDIQCVVSVACNTGDQGYDDNSFVNGDHLIFTVSIDNGFYVPIGSFVASPGSDGNSALYHDANLNFDGGDIGDAEVTSSFTDFVLPISSTGTTLKLRATIKMTESREEIVFDNVRLREQTADDTAPTVHSVDVIDDSTIRVYFNEAMSDDANQTSFYSGIENLDNVVLENGNFEAVLNYSVPLEVGTEYTLIIFNVSLVDMASIPIATPYIAKLYYNPTQPDLIITEIMYNDPNAADTLEFIEVYNAEATDIQIGGFTISDAVDFTIPSTLLGPGDTYLIARRDVSASEFYGENFGNYAGSLPNNGGTILIKNTFDQLIDAVIYDDILPWPPAGDGAGGSISLVDPSSDNNIGSNWIGSSDGVGFVDGEAVYASPGYIPTGILPVIQFTAAEFAVEESDASITIPMTISASNSSESVANLNWAIGGTADGTDISLSGNEVVTFPASSTGNIDLLFSVINDTDMEGFEWIKLEITGTTNSDVGLYNSTNILIIDDEFVVPDLYINEIQSVNQFDIVDESGQNEDWIEIYNPNAFAVDIGGYFISDDVLELTKDRINYESGEAVIPAMSWILLWADKDKGQGPLHVDIKLSSLGEAVVLTAPDGTTSVDVLGFPELSPDQTFGRETDGGSSLIILPTSTPDASNESNGVDDFLLENNIAVYPNPTNSMIFWNQLKKVSVYNAFGQEVLNNRSAKSIDLSNLSEGIYFIHLGEEKPTIHKIIVKK